MNTKALNILLFFLFIAFSSCVSNTYTNNKTITESIEKQEFTFLARRAFPSNFDVIQILGSHSTRILNLDYGYTFEIKNNEINSNLPYFGRVFTPNFNREKEGLTFVSKKISVENKDGKKGSKILTIIPKDINHIEKIIIQIYPNGSANLSINATDRQSISFDGELIFDNTKQSNLKN